MAQWYGREDRVGDRYEGEWKECLKHGNGTDFFANGDTYAGQYKFGKPCGYGEYLWKNGNRYVGSFHDGLKHGFGKWRKSREGQSNTYEGQYFRDKKQGFGIFRWTSGNVYRGQYKADEREGLGEMRWTDGSLYLGEWRHGIQHGYGRMVFADGSMKEGRFENNIYKGPVSAPEIPEDLRSAEFDIMAYAPQNVSFSEDALNFPPVPPPRAAVPTAPTGPTAPMAPMARMKRRTTRRTRFPTADRVRDYSANSAQNTTASPIHTVVYQRPERSFSRAPPRHTTQSRVQYRQHFRTPADRSKLRSFSHTARTLAQQTSARPSRRRSPMDSTLLEPLQKPRPMERSNRHHSQTRKVWRPSGVVHYADRVVRIRHLYS